jgi:protein SCO1/2
VPDFSLTDQLGRPATRSDLAGQPWVADFIFTRCGGPCPRMSERMARMVKAMGHDAGVRFVSFTVDPDYDTPAVLGEYAAALGADAAEWRFLTGSRAQIHRLSIDGFHLAMGDAEVDSATALMNVAHSTRFILVDGAGIIRGYYDGEDEAALAMLSRDLKGLLRNRS